MLSRRSDVARNLMGSRAAVEPPIRLLSYNQGAANSGMLGAASFDAALRASLALATDISVESLTAPASTFGQRLAQRPWPPLARYDLDLHTPRWHSVESLKARRIVRAAISSGGEPDVLMVNTHAVSLALLGLMRRVPTILSLDVLFAEWDAMGIWRKPRRHSPVLLKPSLRIEAAVLGSASLVLAWSKWSAEQVLRRQPQARVVCHHPGVDTALYRPATRRQRDRHAVLFIGGRFEAKGGMVLIRCLEPYLSRGIDLHIVTAEDVPSRPGVFLHRLNGGQPELVDLMQQCDVLCCPRGATLAHGLC